MICRSSICSSILSVCGWRRKRNITLKSLKEKGNLSEETDTLLSILIPFERRHEEFLVVLLADRFAHAIENLREVDVMLDEGFFIDTIRNFDNKFIDTKIEEIYRDLADIRQLKGALYYIRLKAKILYHLNNVPIAKLFERNYYFDYDKILAEFNCYYIYLKNALKFLEFSERSRSKSAEAWGLDQEQIAFFERLYFFLLQIELVLVLGFDMFPDLNSLMKFGKRMEKIYNYCDKFILIASKLNEKNQKILQISNINVRIQNELARNTKSFSFQLDQKNIPQSKIVMTKVEQLVREAMSLVPEFQFLELEFAQKKRREVETQTVQSIYDKMITEKPKKILEVARSLFKKPKHVMDMDSDDSSDLESVKSKMISKPSKFNFDKAK